MNKVKVGQRVEIKGREDLGRGEVLRVSDAFGSYQADVLFEEHDSRRLEIFPLERLQPIADIWERLATDQIDAPLQFLLKQLAYQLPLQNSGGQLSNSRTHLLPHQILLTRDVVAARNRRFLIADEVGLGKTIETGMIIRELISRHQAERILIITPAGLTKNWKQELQEAFRLPFEILGIDFREDGMSSWEIHKRVIVSIDTIKKSPRLERLQNGPMWDLVIFDEAHHLSRTKYGKKITTTQNYRLAEVLRHRTRDLLFLSATPHQGDKFQFWSLVQLLDDTLFDSEEALLEHRGLLNRVMMRRTKREVTDNQGKPIFMRRQVSTQSFQQSARERMFYDRLTDYLREGYSAAGLGESRTTSEQRAIGFVMTTFQKIMSSSIRAIRQALQRRLMVLLIRHQLALEEKRHRQPSNASIAEEILKLKDEMDILAARIIGISRSANQQLEIERYIAQIRQSVHRKLATISETTEWSLDADEEGDEGIYAVADIPDEIRKVRELIASIPENRDRKFDTLIRAIEEIRRNQPKEKFLIFTQYRETLEFLKEELGQIYGADNVVTIKGGPLEDKIAAVEKFWDEQGAQFLISTSAGGEGINLQVCHILFNYDLPWNPMAVEQRIGRIHRYGQNDTAQVYNLVAEDTVEEKIYSLLERKLTEIALQIGKIDPVTHEPREDFRSEILGFLGASPNYLDLYKKALVDRDYQRTEREITEALEKARQASEALASLTQDLGSFNLQSYLNLEGKYTLADLKLFVEAAILQLGGSILPAGELYKIETPKILQRYPDVRPIYESVAFDRDIAMRKRKAELMGLGHPLVDAMIAHLKKSSFYGDISRISGMTTMEMPYVVAVVLFILEFDLGARQQELKLLRISQSGDVQLLPEDWLLSLLKAKKYAANEKTNLSDFNVTAIRQAYEGAIGAMLSQMRLSVPNQETIVNQQIKLLGLLKIE